MAIQESVLDLLHWFNVGFSGDENTDGGEQIVGYWGVVDQRQARMLRCHKKAYHELNSATACEVAGLELV